MSIALCVPLSCKPIAAGTSYTTSVLCGISRCVHVVNCMAAGCLLEGYRQLLQLATPIPSRHQSIPVYAVCMASSL